MAIALSLSSITDELRKLIHKLCIVKPNKNIYEDDPKPVVCFAVNKEENSIYVPFGLWRNFLDPEQIEWDYPKANINVNFEPYTTETDPDGCRDQNIVIPEALERLEENRTVFLALHTGYGKTSCAIYLSSLLGLKTAVLCHFNTVNNQWEDNYEKKTSAKIQRVEGKCRIDKNADVYIIGIQKAKTLNREDLSHIGLVILDEAHIAVETAFSISLLKFQPKYVIGLSATPRRADGLQKLLTMYFGPQENFIIRQQTKEFTVYKVQTPFKPQMPIKYKIVKGTTVPDYTHIINTVEYNPERHDLIVDLVSRHPNERILILSKRKDQCRGIFQKIINRGIETEENVKLMIGPSKKKDRPPSEFRILVAGAQKVGVGFDDPGLKILIICSDCKDVVQWEGRIRANNNTIYHLIDDYKTFEKHWKDHHEPWYIKKGGTIEILNYRKNGPTKSNGFVPSKRLLKNK